tara:strand:- start:198 stop:680 length:483 start_codon:yes stop_codon:yes gene_type:complete
MKKLLGIVVLGLIVTGCAINQTALNIGTNYSDYERECRKVALVKPKLVFNDGNLRGYHCADAAGADIWRYEFFDTSNKLVKVWSRPVSAQERQARFNNALLGLAILNSGTASGTTTQTQQPPGFFSFDISSGMNKVCFYDQLGSLSATTIGRAEICPLSN